LINLKKEKESFDTSILKIDELANSKEKILQASNTINEFKEFMLNSNLENKLKCRIIIN
jgi:hypothetical protein